MSYSESIAIAKVLHIRTSFCCQNDFVKIEMNKIAILSFYNLLMGYSINQSYHGILSNENYFENVHT